MYYRNRVFKVEIIMKLIYDTIFKNLNTFSTRDTPRMSTCPAKLPSLDDGSHCEMICTNVSKLFKKIAAFDQALQYS